MLVVPSGAQVQPQIILDLDYLPDYLSVSYDYGNIECFYLNFEKNFNRTFAGNYAEGF